MLKKNNWHATKHSSLVTSVHLYLAYLTAVLASSWQHVSHDSEDGKGKGGGERDRGYIRQVRGREVVQEEKANSLSHTYMPIHTHVCTTPTLRASRQASTGSKRGEYMMRVGRGMGEGGRRAGTRCHQSCYAFPPSANTHTVRPQPHMSHVVIVASLLLWRGTQCAVST